jgi:hypothetical protein
MKVLEGLEISKEEFFWAFNIVSSRHTIFGNDNTALKESPDHKCILTPLLDFVNHSFDPNCIIELETEEMKGKTMDFICLKAIKPIPIGE